MAAGTRPTSPACCRCCSGRCGLRHRRQRQPSRGLHGIGVDVRAGGMDLNMAMILVATPERANAAELARLQARADEVARRIPGAFGCRLQQVFGMAEGLVNYTRDDDPEELVLGTQGRAISPDDEVRVLDEDGAPVPEGEAGLLWTRGPYTIRGYLGGVDAESFDAEGFYRTGDRVRRPSDGRPMTFLGRVDSQTKINGHRVELGEIEAVLMREGPVDVAVALGWPKTPAGASGVVAFLVDGGLPPNYDQNALLDRAAITLPSYMVPATIVITDGDSYRMTHRTEVPPT